MIKAGAVTPPPEVELMLLDHTKREHLLRVIESLDELEPPPFREVMKKGMMAIMLENLSSEGVGWALSEIIAFGHSIVKANERSKT